MEAIAWAANAMPKTEDGRLPIMAIEEVQKARAFHESFPQYRATPLAKLEQPEIDRINQAMKAAGIERDGAKDLSLA